MKIFLLIMEVSIMKIAVVSYSMTGNNDALARSVAGTLGAEHIKVAEDKPRTNGTIVSDLLFNRTPRLQQPDGLDGYDLVLLFGPVWLGTVATPLRAYLKRLKENKTKYAFVSISGGADGPNPKLAGELKKRTGYEPLAVVDLHIADLLPAEPKPQRQDTQDYKLRGGDIERLTSTVVKAVNEKAVACLN
jgi:hypothetical protein